jgi:GDP-D-mannose 3', 5'-epimerase
MKTALVCGAGGFIGAHLARHLKNDRCKVRGVDRVLPQFASSEADEFILGDLRDANFCREIIDQPFDEVYQLAAEMGGAEYTYTGHNDLNIMLSSAQINLNVLRECQRSNVRRLFFSSSACVYPERNQLDPLQPDCAEASAYPAQPDSEYGWEKLFSERLFATLGRSSDVETRIARYHNIFGPEGTWKGGREKAPAALCRKIAMARDGDTIDIFGDGEQSRSFLYISEGIEGTLRLMRSDVPEPLNIGSEELVTINQLADAIMGIAGKRLIKNHIAGPTGVRGRNSHNQLIRDRLAWAPSAALHDGLQRTYAWVEQQVRATA